MMRFYSIPLNQSISQADFPNSPVYDASKTAGEALFNFQSLRRMFYLVRPDETTYKDLHTIPNFTDEAIGWFLILVVIEFVAHRLQGRHDGYAIDDAVTSACGGLLSLLTKLLEHTAAFGVYMYIYDNYRLVDLPWHSTITWIVAFTLEDLLYYLAHRACHEIGILWAFHQMHHSSEYYNLSTALRQSCVQMFAFAPFHTVSAFFVPPQAWMVHRYLNVLFQFWIHTEVIPKLGPLDWVVNTPSHHRVHHGRNPYCIDKNYAGTLIIWDRLFGTFSPEKDNEPIAYGLVTPVASFDQLWLQLFEFKWFGWDKPLRMSNLLDAIKAPFYPAGWEPGMKTTRFLFWLRMADTEEGIPKIEGKVERYASKAPAWARIYSLVQFFEIAFIYLLFMKGYTTGAWSSTQFGSMIAYQFATTQCISNIFEQRKHAYQLEIVRLIAELMLVIPWTNRVCLHDPFMMTIRYVICILSLAFALYATLFPQKAAVKAE